MAKRYELHLDADNEDWLHRDKKKKDEDDKSKDKKKKASQEANLRNEIIKLAYEKPELREYLLPLLKE